MRNKQFGTLFAAAAVICALVMSCGDKSSKAPAPAAASSGTAQSSLDYSKNKLAISIPLTGNLMQYGVSYRNAIQLAVADFNKAGGLNGVDVALEINDDKGDQREAINLANRIIEDPKVFAVVGSFGSSVSMASAPVYQRAGLPMVSPNTSHPDYPGMGDMMVPISPTAAMEKVNTAQLFSRDFGGKPLAILYQNTDLGVTSNGIIQEEYKKNGGVISAVETFVPGQTKDFTPLLSKIKAANPYALYIDAEYNDTAAIIIQADQMGFGDIRFCGPGNAIKFEFLNLVGTRADGMILSGTTPVYDEKVMAASANLSNYVKDFTRRYNELYPSNPCDGFAGAAYDAAMLAMTAARNVGTADAKTLIQEMLRVPVETVSGLNVRYEGNNIFKDMYVYRVENGAFVGYDVSK
jgi:branched-chain amino acid transport system substrate-binding protein